MKHPFVVSVTLVIFCWVSGNFAVQAAAIIGPERRRFASRADGGYICCPKWNPSRETSG
jgi:hypothetical protein